MEIPSESVGFDEGSKSETVPDAVGFDKGSKSETVPDAIGFDEGSKLEIPSETVGFHKGSESGGKFQGRSLNHGPWKISFFER